MRWRAVPEGDTALGIPCALTFHQLADTPRQSRDLLILPRDHLREVIDGALQMRDLFFELRHDFALPEVAWRVNAVAPVARLR